MRSALSLTLLVVLIALPVAPVLASEIGVTEVSDTAPVGSSQSSTAPEEAETEEDFYTEEIAEAPEEVVFDSSDVTADVVSEEEAPPITDTEEVTSESDADPESINEDADDTVDAGAGGESGDGTETATSTEIVLDEEVVVAEEENSDEGDSAVDDTADDATDEEESSEGLDEVRIPEAENLIAVNAVTNDENLYSFSRDECTLVGDGSFYCAKMDDVVIAHNADRIFAATDRDGDKEIFVEHAGEITAFTENTVDDDAPYYDETSDSIVWHRLIDGRYQILSHVLEEESELQLTSTSYNNMEPSRYGDATVWQSWMKSGWEIMLLDDGELVQLTKNDVPDIAPSINKNYIVWQSQEDGAWSAKVYDRGTGDIETIEDAEGLSIENARFVLVYDTKDENGDIETRGYDPKTKRSVPLSATPASIPDELPEPDQTGEERALVQTVTQLKPKTGEDDPLPTGDPLDSDDLSDGATSTDSEIEDVVLPPADEEEALIDDVEDTATSSPELPPELVIEAIPETESPTEHISDVVIPPFTPELADPQEGIASDE
jgi:hypothetical protein